MFQSKGSQGIVESPLNKTKVDVGAVPCWYSEPESINNIFLLCLSSFPSGFVFPMEFVQLLSFVFYGYIQ